MGLGPAILMGVTPHPEARGNRGGIHTGLGKWHFWVDTIQLRSFPGTGNSTMANSVPATRMAEMSRNVVSKSLNKLAKLTIQPIIVLVCFFSLFHLTIFLLYSLLRFVTGSSPPFRDSKSLKGKRASGTHDSETEPCQNGATGTGTVPEGHSYW